MKHPKYIYQLKPAHIHLTHENRLFGSSIPIVALTGGIGSGKTTVLLELKKRGMPVISADELVKNIYLYPETKTFIEERFPMAIVKGKINFRLLRQLAFKNENNLAILEGYIHPLLKVEFDKALAHFPQAKFIVYEVPLLFEKKLNDQVDLSVLVYSPYDVQLTRLKERDQIDNDLAINILNAQMKIDEKKEKADMIIRNDTTLNQLMKNIDSFLEEAFTKTVVG